MENAKLVRFERIKFGVKKPKPVKGPRRLGMVMQLFDKITEPFTVKSLEEMARAEGLYVPVRPSTLRTLKRLRKIGLIRMIDWELGRAAVYEKVKI